MDKVKKAKTIFFAVSALALLQLVICYLLLPEKAAVHFKFSGAADDWWDKEYFVVLWAVTLAFLIGIFSLVGYATSSSPDSTINLPNKQWWLAPERRAETISLVVRDLYQIATATILFLGVMLHLVLRANLNGSGNLGPLFIPLLGLYLAYCVIFVIQRRRQFGRIPEGRN